MTLIQSSSEESFPVLNLYNEFMQYIFKNIHLVYKFVIDGKYYNNLFYITNVHNTMWNRPWSLLKMWLTRNIIINNNKNKRVTVKYILFKNTALILSFQCLKFESIWKSSYFKNHILLAGIILTYFLWIISITYIH